MTRLTFDDQCWQELQTRNPLDQPITEILQQLLDQPDDLQTFRDFWPSLCSEDTAWPAAYAALPYLVDAAEQSQGEALVDYLIFFGYLRECTHKDNVPQHLRLEFDAALQRALDLFTRSWATITCDANTFRHLLASFAALRGEINLARFLSNADCGCPHCQADLLKEYP